MFKFLKDKLKKAVSKFSEKVEKEAEDVEVEESFFKKIKMAPNINIENNNVRIASIFIKSNRASVMSCNTCGLYCDASRAV